MRGHAVVGEQGVQERAQNAPPRDPSVEDQRGRHVVAYSYHLSPRVLSLVMIFVGTMVLNAEL